MNSEEQNQFVTKADFELLKSQLDQIVEAMTTLAKRDDHVQRNSVNNFAQDQPVQTPVWNQIIQEHTIVRDGHSSSLDDTDYQTFAFSVPDSQEAIPVMEPKDPQYVEIKEKCRALEKKLDIIKGRDSADLNALNMCLVPDLVMPPKFKTPKFKKYKGDSCLKQHLVMYCRRMTSHIRNDKLMIHCFQDSLSGTSLYWYMQLESNNIRSWSDLASSFVKQYNYNLDLAPSRLHLLDLSQEDNESFRRYAQRWREITARVQPPLLDKELVDWFVDTLQGPYREKLFSIVTSNFSDLVMAGERIESGLKSGKIQGTSNTLSNESESVVNSQEELEEESQSIQESLISQSQRSGVSTVRSQQSFGSPHQTPSFHQRQYLPPNQRLPQYQRSYHHHPRQHARQRTRKSKRHFTPLPMSYTQILPELIQSGLIVPKEIDPVTPLYLPGFDVNVQCDYHVGAHGHSTEDCKVLRSKVQNLLDSEMISFTPQGIQINNPSFGQEDSSIHIVEEITEIGCEDASLTDLDNQP